MTSLITEVRSGLRIVHRDLGGWQVKSQTMKLNIRSFFRLEQGRGGKHEGNLRRFGYSFSLFYINTLRRMGRVFGGLKVKRGGEKILRTFS